MLSLPEPVCGNVPDEAGDCAGKIWLAEAVFSAGWATIEAVGKTEPDAGAV